MMSASTATSSSGHQTSAPVARASGATAPTWSKCVCVSRIAATSSPSAPISATSRSASSPGSITIASRAPSSHATWQFSCTGPTVNERTSIALALLLLARRDRAARLAHPPLPEDAIDLVAERDVDQERRQRQSQRRSDALLLAREPDLEEHEQHHRGDAGARGGAGERRHRVAPVPAHAALATALLPGGRLAPSAPARLDRACGIAAMLATALALRLGHDRDVSAGRRAEPRSRRA